MESFRDTCLLLPNNQDLSSYFVNNNINLESFITRYIDVDKALQRHLVGNAQSMDTQIDFIKSCLLSQAQEINNLSQCLNNMHSHMSSTIKDITNNDIKCILSEHLQLLQTHIQTNSSPTLLKDFLQNFQDKIVNINSEQLNDIDRKTISLLSNFQSNLLKDLSTTLDSHTIHHKITSINDTLTTLHSNFTGNSSQKGKMTENILYYNLVKAFPDSDVILTRDQSDSCDIQIKREGRPHILIDSKHCEASNVRKGDLDKFYDDCKINDSCGILCNTFGGIANRKHFEIDIQDKRVYVFLSNHQFDPTMFQIASRIIYNLYDIIKDKRSDVIQIEQQLYQRLKIEYNFFLQSFHQYIDNIRSNINSLSQLSFTHLDQFFKRTSMITEGKPFSCSMCGTGCASDKALKKHLKDKHQIVLTSQRIKKVKTDDSDEN
jgi:hypothetical protein